MATDGVLLLQVPPGVELSVILALIHTADGPPMVGNGLIVIVLVVAQPVPKV